MTCEDGLDPWEMHQNTLARNCVYSVLKCLLILRWNSHFFGNLLCYWTIVLTTKITVLFPLGLFYLMVYYTTLILRCSNNSMLTFIIPKLLWSFIIANHYPYSSMNDHHYHWLAIIIPKWPSLSFRDHHHPKATNIISNWQYMSPNIYIQLIHSDHQLVGMSWQDTSRFSST